MPAATSISDRVSAGSATSRCRKPCSTLAGTACAPVSPNPPASCAGFSPRQLQQRQRAAVRLGQDPVPDPLIQAEPNHRTQQRTGVLIRQPPELQLRQPRELITGLARGEDQPHPPMTPRQALRGQGAW